MWDGFDKRKFPRMKLPCEIEIKSVEKAEPISATTENVGMGGVCVMLSKSLERFSQCRLKLVFGEKNKETLRCHGKVVWIVRTGDVRGRRLRYDVGIEFLDMPDKERALLKQHIDEFAQDQEAQEIS